MKKISAQGFTLIELLVIASVVGMLVSGAVVAYFKFQTKVDVVATGQRFEQVLKKAETMARTRVDEGKCGTSEFEGYEISVTGGSSAGTVSTSFKQICKDLGNVNIETVNIADKTSVFHDSTPTLIYDFYTLQSNKPNEVPVDKTVSFKTADDDACYTVTINELGVVSGEFSRPCPL